MNQNILYTACVTPFTKDAKSVDYVAFEAILQRQAKAGNGVVIFGSTGEGLSLSRQEKEEMLDRLMCLQLNTQVIVGVPSHNLQEALEWIAFCNAKPINGYLMTTPIYTKPGIMGQTQWFETLLDAAEHPAMLYNNPGRSGVRLHAETVKNLAQHSRFMAIKDSGGSVDSMIDYQIVAPHIPIYCGDDYLMPAMAAERAVGLVSMASNAWPKAVREYVQVALHQQKMQYGSEKIWWQTMKALVSASNPIPIKALLKAMGVIEYDTVRLPLSQDDFNGLEELMDYHAIISGLES